MCQNRTHQNASHAARPSLLSQHEYPTLFFFLLLYAYFVFETYFELKIIYINENAPKKTVNFNLEEKIHRIALNCYYLVYCSQIIKIKWMLCVHGNAQFNFDWMYFIVVQTGNKLMLVCRIWFGIQWVCFICAFLREQHTWKTLPNGQLFIWFIYNYILFFYCHWKDAFDDQHSTPFLIVVTIVVVFLKKTTSS